MAVRARVAKVQAQQLNVDLGSNVKGRVHITECDWRESDGDRCVSGFRVYLGFESLGLGFRFCWM